MNPAVTLVHQAAMPIGIHAIRTFAQHFSNAYRLEIHTDGSVDEENQKILLEATKGMKARIVLPSERKPILDERLANYPKTRALLNGVGYNAKLELPMAASGSYFYFDSDIIWLKPVSNLAPSSAPNAFSTESWSWYNGIANDRLWIEAKTPRRVNSGFYFLGEPFPFARMEEMLERKMFDPAKRYNTDQEIMAYLFPNMEYYHPDDLKRSRVGKHYNLQEESCAALHFPGGMWQNHLDHMSELPLPHHPSAMEIRYEKPAPLDRLELMRMRLQVQLSDSPTLGRVINSIRRLRGRLR